MPTDLVLHPSATLYVCKHCGAIFTDAELHERWHADMQADTG